jgi:predicted dehydrogenase
MGDLLRLCHEHPQVEIVGIADLDPARMEGAAKAFGIPQERHYSDFRKCLDETKPDIAILCPKTGEHGDYVEWVAPYGCHVLLEKPMAASLKDADRMMRAVEATGKTLAINWPLAWYPPHLTTRRLIEEGTIGEVQEVHYYDGNRGPLRHLADKEEVGEAEAARLKSQSWWYQKETGGGSLLDYLGYGVTLGTWFHSGKAPLEVTCTVDAPLGLEVDEHSITVARYDSGLSKFETRWGTFTDPWTLQPQPKCGFVVVGTQGTIASYDYEQVIRVQTAARPEATDMPVDDIQSPFQNPIQHLIHVLDTGAPLHGPLTPAMCRVGQQIVDSAVLSAQQKRTVQLLD